MPLGQAVAIVVCVHAARYGACDAGVKPRRPPRPGRHLTMEMAEDLTESMHEEAARLRDEIKRMKKMDLEFAQDMMSS